jgi:hypothetical protein
MKTMMAYCGLICESCPIHLATLEKNKSRQQMMRESIAEQCANIYGMNLPPEEVTDCDGCRSVTGRLFSGCNNCAIRKCASGLNIEGCAFCPDYTCAILKEHFLHDPTAQARLEKIRHAN